MPAEQDAGLHRRRVGGGGRRGRTRRGERPRPARARGRRRGGDRGGRRATATRAGGGRTGAPCWGPWPDRSQQGRLGPSESCTVPGVDGGRAAIVRWRRPVSRRPFAPIRGGPVPEIRPFRALRYDRRVVGDPALVVAPPYDVIGPDEHERLLARASGQRRPARPARSRSPATSPTTAIAGRPGRSRRGARTGPCTRTRIRRSTSTSRPTACPGTTWSGPSAASSPGSGSRHSGPAPASCRTSARWPGRKEDRYKLLRATGVNTSPVVGLYDDPAVRAARRPGGARRRAPRTLDVVDDDGVRHRLWAVPADGDGAAAVAAAARGRRRRAGHDRRRPPPLRDGAALSRRAADDAARARRIRRSTTC